MSKGLYMKTITPGRYRKTVRYTRVLPGDVYAHALQETARKAADALEEILEKHAWRQEKRCCHQPAFEALHAMIKS